MPKRFRNARRESPAAGSGPVQIWLFIMFGRGFLLQPFSLTLTLSRWEREQQAAPFLILMRPSNPGIRNSERPADDSASPHERAGVRVKASSNV